MTIVSIKRLDKGTIERIAAGEVVERPSSVVKELVENSLDSKASHIVIEVRDGGASLISVADNGCGISQDELPLALERHTTSKITTDADLWQLTTLGFRGEALASIGAVSKLTISSRVDGAQGASVTSVGGQVQDLKTSPRPTGTTVLVEDLFFNVPARRKFMSSPRSETVRAVRAVSDTSMAHLDVHFKFVSNQTVLLDLPPTADARGRLALIHSPTEAKEMLRIEHSKDQMFVCGFLTRPGLTRSNRTHLTILVNNRPVTSKEIGKAVLLGYDQRIARGRFPYGFVHVEVPSKEVDVNVSPTKSEVRFKNASFVASAVVRAVRKALEDSSEATPPPNIVAHRLVAPKPKIVHDSQRTSSQQQHLAVHT
ncbi:MAG TPA: DNA mismatch repair endonuclease MutL, partial [Euryarchaeota archaeon]|nr:DNA mismatch repair endonuclease MutL [Euryarchaeota archaeon]